MAITEYNYIPKYIKRTIANKPKDVVTASYWNELFNLLITQGDHTAEELGNVLNRFTAAINEVKGIADGRYVKPTNGIPKTDLANDVQTSLSKADTALQTHQSLAAYRTALAQDIIDSDLGDRISAIENKESGWDNKQDKLIAGTNITIAADGKTISATGGGGAEVFIISILILSTVEVEADKTYAEIKAAIDAGDTICVKTIDDIVYTAQVANTNTEIELLWIEEHSNSTLCCSAIINSENAWSVTVHDLVNTNKLAFELNYLGEHKVDKITGKGLSTNDYTDADKTKVDTLAPVAESGSYNDLTDKPVIPSVPTAAINANTAARHEHSNKTVLDLISETVKAAWDAASTWVTTNGANVLSHLSDSIKHITAAERTKWNGKQDKLIAGDNITIAADGKTISATGGGGGVSGDNIETVEAQQIDIPSKLSDFENDSGFVTNSAVEAALADKQDTISDLENIRSGAGKGATALQAVPSTYRTASAQDVIDNGLSDRVSAIEGKEAGWNGKYLKPTGGIPKADLAAAVQTSLGKADTALQSVPSTYRTASAQDTIDSGKVDKVTGKGLSTNDYTNAAKAKVDAIPANPKYTDTVYDDTAVKSRLSAVEGKLNGSGSASFASIETAALKATGEVEVFGTQPHMDFHYGNSTSDYTSRIIETESGKINIAAPNGVAVNDTPLTAESVTLTANTDRITNVSYTAKYLPLIGAVFVRIYGKINAELNTGYDYDLFSIGSRLPNSIAALSVKCGKNAMANAKTASGSGAIQIRPFEPGITGYDVYITGFWFV